MNTPPKDPSLDPPGDGLELDEDEEAMLDGFLRNASPEERKVMLADLEVAKFLLMPAPP
jgi:hypothetical protein